jgi:uncharacterized protein YkwD
MKRILVPSLLLGFAVLALAADKDDKDKEKLTLSADEQAILKLTNNLRAKEKLPPLKPNALLFEAARAHSKNMAKQGKLAHVLDDKEPTDRIAATGYKRSYVGENVVGGQQVTPKRAFQFWVESEPHRKNLLNEKFEDIGIGIARDKKGDVYYTQVFATPNNAGAGGKGDAELDKAVQKILELTNEARKKENLEPLKLNDTLSKVAKAHSMNMAKQKKMEHVLDGMQPHERVEKGGYDYASVGENIAFSGELDVPQVFEGWMKSKIHREHILGAEFKEIGIGLARGETGDVYYTQVFGTQRKKK